MDVNEVDDEAAEQQSRTDPSSLDKLASQLAVLKDFALRFDFEAISEQDLNKCLQDADMALRELVTEARERGIRILVGIYFFLTIIPLKTDCHMNIVCTTKPRKEKSHYDWTL